MVVPNNPEQPASDAQVLQRPLHGEDGPWLIMSHYHGMWHRRSEDGHACGYTGDILRAGIFELSTAEQYNDWGTLRGRDEAVPVSRYITAFETRLIEMDHEREALVARVAMLRARLPSPPQELGEGGA
jgi:hypothetical protein